MNQPDGQGYITVSLPRPLVERIEARIRGTGFASPAAYVEYVLGEVLSDDPNPGDGFSPEDEEALKEKLRALGYLG